jgi:transposase-like protein
MSQKLKSSRGFPKEFREKAVRLVTETGCAIEDVAKQLGCSAESIRRWKKKYKQEANPEAADRMERDESELKRVKKENVQLKMELDFLKKAAAYFAKESL